MKKVLLIIAGSLLLALGAVGIVIPVMPTTPFVLIAAACFSMSSEKLHKMLLSSRIFGPYIRHYKDKTGVPLRLKIGSLIFLWATLTVSAILINKLVMYIVLASIGAAITVHLLLMRAKRPDKNAQPLDAPDQVELETSELQAELDNTEQTENAAPPENAELEQTEQTVPPEKVELDNTDQTEKEKMPKFETKPEQK